MVRDQRRLAAIISADVAGYSRLMGRDDSDTLARLKAHRRGLIDPKIAEYGGRIVKTTGDGLLLEFPSVVDAVRCAVDVQRDMAERNSGLPPDQRIDFRIGINVGDIIIDDDDIFGDGVNVAARVQTLAEPGGICASKVVRDQVLDKLSFSFEDLGAQQVKNIARPVEVYRVDLGSEALPTPSSSRRRLLRLTRALKGPWLAVGIVVIGLSGVALWSLPQFWKVAPDPTPPAMSVAIASITAPSSDTDVSRLAEVLSQNVATRLSREGGWGFTPRARVASVSIAATGGSRTVTATDLARTANVRYVFEGELLRSGNGYAANLRLIDGVAGGQVWSQGDVWQDADIAESSAKLRNVTKQVRNAIQGAETRRVVAQPLAGLSATELVLRAIDLGNRNQSLAGTIEARKLVDEALRREPNLVPALMTRTLLADRELDADPDAAHRDRILREYDELTNRIISLAPIDPVAWDHRSFVLMYLGRWDAALEANTMAIKLAPYDADSYTSRAWLMNMTGRPAEALSLIERALAIDPPMNPGFELRLACEAHLLLGQAQQAIRTCEKARGLYNDDLIIGLFLAAVYANHGDLVRAAAVKSEVQRIAPGYTIAQLRAKRYSDHPEYQPLAEKYWYEGLRKAGLPEN